MKIRLLNKRIEQHTTHKDRFPLRSGSKRFKKPADSRRSIARVDDRLHAYEMNQLATSTLLVIS
jgi:hypothetical protein